MMNSFQRILVATDGSEASLKAAARLPAAYVAVDVLYVEARSTMSLTVMR